MFLLGKGKKIFRKENTFLIIPFASKKVYESEKKSYINFD